MADDTVTTYASGLVATARAEGVLDRLTDELYEFAQAVAGHERLRNALADQTVPLQVRMAGAEDLLGRAHALTTAAVVWLLAAGKARDLAQIAEEVAAQAAASRGAKLAEVRSAMPLKKRQQTALAKALERIAGNPVELRVVVDPGLMGGLTVRLGDTVIDGSLAHRLDELKSLLSTG